LPNHPVNEGRAHARVDPEPREDFGDSSKPFQHPGRHGLVGTRRPRGGDPEPHAAAPAADDGIAISANEGENPKRARCAARTSRFEKILIGQF